MPGDSPANVEERKLEAIATLVQQHGIKQIALVVRDLDASMRAYWDLLRMGPWNAYTLTPEILKDMHYRGEPGHFSFRHALAWKDGVQMELVQPVSGRSIFADHLEEHPLDWRHRPHVIRYLRAWADLLEERALAQAAEPSGVHRRTDALSRAS